jgi:hypothetical protein
MSKSDPLSVTAEYPGGMQAALEAHYMRQRDGVSPCPAKARCPVCGKWSRD